MEIKILKANKTEDIHEWKMKIMQLPLDLQDVFFLPEYVYSYEIEGRGEANCALISDHEAFMLYPFLKSEIPLKFEFNMGTVYYDIQSPYGYSGPLVNSEGFENNFIQKAWDLFSLWCSENNIVNGFCRFHPFLENHTWVDKLMEVVLNRETVHIDLKTYPTSVWADPHFLNHRGMVRRGMREGYSFHIENFKNNLKQFSKKYFETQLQLNADPETFFSEEYFKNLFNLGKNIWMGVIRKDNAPLTAVVVLEGEKYAYLHLMAYFQEGPAKGMVNFLYHEVAIVTSKHGKKLLQIGGGKTSKHDDPLFLFKKRLSPFTHKYYIGKRVYKQDIQEKLIEFYITEFGLDSYEKKKHILQFYR